MSTNSTILNSNFSGAKPIQTLVRPFREFFAREAAGGILLLFATVIALAWANSPWASSYFALWHATIAVGDESGFSRDIHFWINDGFMALFFFVVGLEIKREFVGGELASPRQAVLPVAAAVGGVAIPALLFSAVNFRGSGAPGWGVPMATDIAFVIGVMALLGPRAPTGLKIFMTALAIVDDLAAVIAIALVYTAHISWTALSLAALCLGALYLTNWLTVRHPVPYIVLGLLLWGAILESGVHPTVAGVLVAIAIPCRTPLLDFERALHPWVTFLVMPLFALANAGVHFDARMFSEILQPVPLGIVLGLVLGKPLGITFGAWVAVRTKLAALPRGVSWRQLNAAGWLGGIGFTMSIFIAGLAFTSEALLNLAKLGILTASVLAGAAGSVLLIASKPTPAQS